MCGYFKFFLILTHLDCVFQAAGTEGAEKEEVRGEYLLTLCLCG